MHKSLRVSNLSKSLGCVGFINGSHEKNLKVSFVHMVYRNSESIC